MEKMKIIYILGGAMNFGGTEAFIMNYYRHIDHEKVAIDFIYQGDQNGVYDGELLACGSKIYHVPFKSRHPIAFSKGVAKILKEGSYEIIHSQMDGTGAWPLAIAKQFGVPVRIAHSHNTAHQTKNPLKLFFNEAMKRLLARYATDLWACGEEAGRFLFGDRLVDAGKVTIIRNAIDLERYAYSEKKRKKFRDEFGIRDDEAVVGHVGQFREQKNHRKIISVFDEMAKSGAEYRLMLVGSGPLEEEVRHLVRERGLEDKVVFTGARDDVNDLLSAFDVFLFPSLFEGLSLVGIEAQANGMPCVFSDTIPKETRMTELVSAVPLDAPDEVWAEAVYSALRMSRRDCSEELRRAGYDIHLEARKLEKRYMESIRGHCFDIPTKQ